MAGVRPAMKKKNSRVDMEVGILAPGAVGYNHATTPMSELSFQGVTKSFGAVRALKGVTFPVEEGEAHALVGENGAGKSTLMRVLAGIVRPDGGQLVWGGRKLDLRSPRAALDQGIGMVYQEMLLFPNLTVSGNIFAGREITAEIGRASCRERAQRDDGEGRRLG